MGNTGHLGITEGETPNLDLFGVTPAFNLHRGAGRPNGYAAEPGSGPTGESCKTCDNCVRVKLSSKSVYKCELVAWTGGRATDVLVTAPACRFWVRPASTPIEGTQHADSPKNSVVEPPEAPAT